MKIVRIPRIDGGSDIYPAYEVFEFPYDKIPYKEWLYLRHKKKDIESYHQNLLTFDIETTTMPCETPYGFMYHWQACLDAFLVYGRYWNEFEEFLVRIRNLLHFDYKHRIVCYVHNLGYEYQFMQNFLKRSCGELEVFASEKRKPMKVVTASGIEFRCSYKLTNMSLDKAVQNEKGVTHRKASGDLDYRLIRTPETELTDSEFGYCMADVLTLYELIQNRLINEYDNLEGIPLTSTGYVRRDCRNATKEGGRKYRELFERLAITPEIFQLLEEAKRGGNTHANRYKAGIVWHDADSYDVVSSYPFQFFKAYPMTPFIRYGKVESMEELRNLLNTRACLFRCIFNNIKVRDDVAVPYIPKSKCYRLNNSISDNGRVLEAEYLQITLTDIDYKILEKQYTWDGLAIMDMHTSRYGSLPKEIIGCVKKYFRDKCVLKFKIQHEDDQQKKDDLIYLYNKSKNRLNGIFGMAMTCPVHDNIIVNEDGWSIEQDDIHEALEKFRSSRNNFMIYSWGIWITAHARKHLQDLLDITGPGTIYCDTDSSKAINVDHDAVERKNQEIIEFCKRVGAYEKVGGKTYYLGIYEKENVEPIKDFITLGAKKYAYVDQDGFHVTVSGVNKKLGAKEMNSIDNFRLGFIFKDAGGTTSYYNDTNKIYSITVDGSTFETSSNIGIIDSTYTLGITSEYAKIIGFDILD